MSKMFFTISVMSSPSLDLTVQCFLCESVVSIHDYAFIFIPGKRYHWDDNPTFGIRAGSQCEQYGPFKICQECLKHKVTNRIRAKLGLAREP
jgi:hypothetical protein